MKKIILGIALIAAVGVGYFASQKGVKPFGAIEAADPILVQPPTQTLGDIDWEHSRMTFSYCPLDGNGKEIMRNKLDICQNPSIAFKDLTTDAQRTRFKDVGNQIIRFKGLGN